MKLSDKIRYLREVEGSLRGLDRAMTQQETVRAIAESEAEVVEGAKPSKKAKARGATISQSYLSQIESGARPHLTNTTRLLLARFFKVHPGYLVDDPEGYHAELMSDVRTVEDKLDLWLIAGAERFRRDPELCQALLALSRHEDSRRCLLLLESVLETPALVDRLMQVLRPEGSAGRADSLPQRLKPRLSSSSYSTAGAVPSSKASTITPRVDDATVTAEAMPLDKASKSAKHRGGKKELK